MRSLADGLPPEVAAALHPDWRANERAYWAARDGLLAEYAGRWVAFADGAVVAADRRPPVVVQAALASGRHPFVAKVGAEDEPWSRMRRAAFAYDAGYGEPLPVLAAEFRTASGQPGVTFDRVIPDTGADDTALPWADCQALGLNPADGLHGWVSGVGGRVPTLAFQGWVVLDGSEHPCRLSADFFNPERILGRDVLNRLDVLFRGPAGEVVVNP